MINPSSIGIFATSSLHAAGTTLLPSLEAQKHRLTGFDSAYQTAVGRVHDDVSAAITSRADHDRHFRRLDRTAQFSILAGEQLMADLNALTISIPSRTACLVASSRGPTLNWEAQHTIYKDRSSKRLSPFASPTTTPGHLASALQQSLGLTGPAFSLSMTCSSGLWALGNAMAWLHTGWIDAALAGGTEAALSAFTLAQMQSLKVLNTQPNADFPSRPFAAGDTNTMALGEGAALFWLAPVARVEAPPLAVIAGFGFGSEHIPNHAGITAEGENLRTAMAMACGDVRPDMVLTHAPGTGKGDAAEIEAVRKFFGNNHPPLYSNKWCIGHTFGAAGAISVAQAIEVLQSGTCPDMPYPTPCAAAVAEVKSVLVNAVGFGGVAASVLITSAN